MIITRLFSDICYQCQGEGHYSTRLCIHTFGNNISNLSLEGSLQLQLENSS